MASSSFLLLCVCGKLLQKKTGKDWASRIAPYVLAFLYGCKAKGIFEDIPHVEHLTPENFEKKVLKSDRAWLVEFYDPK